MTHEPDSASGVIYFRRG